MNFPKISVLISFYNAEKYILESLKSIVNQTYKNIEILLLDDGSTDNSLKIVKKIFDQRITIYSNLNNKGLNYSINKLINLSNGDYVAIMDADDIARKDRLEVQLNYLRKNNLDVCGSSLVFFGKIREYKQIKLSNDTDIKLLMTIGNPMANPSILIKSKIIKENNYSLKYVSADYELWTRLALKNYKFGNCNETLLKYRVHNNQDSVIKYKRGINESLEIAKNYSKKYYENIKYSKYLRKVKYGFAENIQFNPSIKSIIAMKNIIVQKRASKEILNIFLHRLIIKTYPINLKFVYSLVKFSKKYKIDIKKKYFIFLFLRFIFNFDNNNKIINRVIKIVSKV